ncbi:hypothetical protein HPP92_002872 [Vanilla planifolia]|uniref:Uncharacterized protein n=2 Tax=Vanilla planifolia TaxID=51239 RepID=A0A835S9A6_VANPL|nr:hypothetical protein HPP92_002872 [Vanilla planifolia]
MKQVDACYYGSLISLGHHGLTGIVKLKYGSTDRVQADEKGIRRREERMGNDLCAWLRSFVLTLMLLLCMGDKTTFRACAIATLRRGLGSLSAPSDAVFENLAKSCTLVCEDIMACDCFRDEDDYFFDCRDDESTFFNSSPRFPSTSHASFREEKSDKWTTSDPLYKVWLESPGSIQERRVRFMQLMGLDSVRTTKPDSVFPNGELMMDTHITGEFYRIFSDSGTVLRSYESDNESLLSRSDEVTSSFQEQTLNEQFERRYKDLKDANVDGEFESNCSSSGRLQMDVRSFTSYGQRQMQRGDSLSISTYEKALRSKSFRWLQKLGALACIAGRKDYEYDAGASISDVTARARLQKIQVNACHKKSKEFSGVYMAQNFQAHQGAILTMKFSPDGEYLATGGEDGVVRIWQVLECASKKISSKNWRRTPDSACVVVPPEVFHIAEKPLCEFHGHKGDVLDLAWSNDLCLLSSSADKTVRLWRLGCDSCLNVYAHNNYVTCVQFNPINEEYFISGCIDGKVRIWRISTCRVVDWVDINDIVTAVCYRPDGKVLVVGSLEGDCRFYDASENHLQLDTKFCPSNRRRLMVSCGDSVIRILEGVDVISKYKGLRNAGSHISATFTVNGQHIISASDDSQVYIWSHSNDDHTPSTNSKSISSSEHFTSQFVSIAAPWPGLGNKRPSLVAYELPSSNKDCIEPADVDPVLNNSLYLSPSTSFILNPDFFIESLHRGSATWPAEKLPTGMSKVSDFDKSQFKFLKSSFKKRTSHAWGQVIVTAGWDGRISSFQNYGLPTHL